MGQIYTGAAAVRKQTLVQQEMTRFDTLQMLAVAAVTHQNQQKSVKVIFFSSTLMFRRVMLCSITLSGVCCFQGVWSPLTNLSMQLCSLIFIFIFVGNIFQWLREINDLAKRYQIFLLPLCSLLSYDVCVVATLFVSCCWLQ